MRVRRPGLVLLALCGYLPGLTQGVTLSELREAQAALVKARADYAQRAAALSDAEATDYAAFIAQLNERLALGCVVYTRTGVAVPEDIDCPEPRFARVPPADINQAGEKTRAEHIGVLDAELEAGLGEFDERLLREQERVKAAAPRAASGSDATAGGGGAGDGDSGPPGVAGSVTAVEEGAEGAETQTAAGGVSGQDSAPGAPGKTAATGAPADLPDGSDDDVVARQLREAAEQETDPELKKKLWEEYRKYKQGTQ